MRKLFQTIIYIYLSACVVDLSLLMFRISLSSELMEVHGLKKLGVGVAAVDQVPNPLHLPEAFNIIFADAANLVFPVFVIFGLFTRLAVLPILVVTLTGYFVLHWNDTLLIKDNPYMYSFCYLFILVVGAGKYSLDSFFRKNEI